MESAGAGGPGYTYVGCYNDGSGPYSVDGYARTFPVWLGSGTGLSVDECAAVAQNRGYQVFALQYFGECFLGSLADVAAMDAASLKTTDATCDVIPCVDRNIFCPGMTNKVFWLGGVPGSFKA
jgi:hypothetical protein